MHLLTLFMVLHELHSRGDDQPTSKSESGEKSPGTTRNFSELTQNVGGPQVNYQVSHLPSAEPG